MTDKEKAERIVILLKTVKKLQVEIDKLFEEIGITSCNAGLRYCVPGRHTFQVMDTGASEFAELLEVNTERSEFGEKEDFVFTDIGDGIAVMALEEKKS